MALQGAGKDPKVVSGGSSSNYIAQVSERRSSPELDTQQSAAPPFAPVLGKKNYTKTLGGPRK